MTLDARDGRRSPVSRLFALIPAGGGGSRAGLAVPKQYHALLGKPMIVHTIERLASALPLA
ncbi:MAG: 2-C-methyl-D-erythritol 4-phosphate cytidylyltransferase, partial [Burkholderiales bacterium]|nr:2-C-methyl-D-erythritol 4-phosphate cytidylyltransferase [Burkholderiales bacterium]